MKPRLLIIEDDENLRELLAETLDEEFEIQTAEDGSAALRMGRDFPFDVILTDVRLPGEMDGVEVVSKLKQYRPQAQCVVMTGYADEQVPLRAAKLLVQNYLYKPFDHEELRKALSRCSKSRQTQHFNEGLLNRLLQLPKQLVQNRLKALQTHSMQKLEQVRGEFLQSFYTLIRSRKLLRTTALACWQLFEKVELSYLTARRQDFVGAPVAEWIAALQQARSHMESWAEDQKVQPSEQSEIPQNEFNVLYERIVQGAMAAEHLSSVTVVRVTPLEMREASPALTSFYRFCWDRSYSGGLPAEFELPELAATRGAP
ncbi:MAG: response regulator [Candidatus Eremiobacteraeota bacterium]|nr:response regulator [Candidatus Eremiobacteraeota bacterium]MCW5866744.1 response regulator [Candidatus Eremiobacteraeota bacterium]